MYWFFLVPILAYYIIYPGGKKNWLKRKKEILKIAEVQLPIKDFGVWRHPNYREGLSLRPYHSVDWYLRQGQKTGRNGQLNAKTVYKKKASIKKYRLSFC